MNNKIRVELELSELKELDTILSRLELFGSYEVRPADRAKIKSMLARIREKITSAEKLGQFADNFKTRF